MPSVSIGAGGTAAIAARSNPRNRSRSEPSTAQHSPGFVQNWPTPSVIDAAKPRAISSVRVASASGSRKTGLRLLISANTGIGSGRAAAASQSARPAAWEPVNPTARAAGCVTSAVPITRPSPCSMANTPAGSPQAATALETAPATRSDVPGCRRCAFTTTGLPVHSALAVSPPATENARGKLLEPNTTTGPIGTFTRLRSGRGSGCRAGCGRSMRASRHDSSRATAANSRN